MRIAKWVKQKGFKWPFPPCGRPEHKYPSITPPPTPTLALPPRRGRELSRQFHYVTPHLPQGATENRGGGIPYSYSSQPSTGLKTAPLAAPVTMLA